ncbi:hypothetical protein EV692_1084 [Lonepinella koalarum]|uniref:Uncharacterized protein n=1 Tax=Lonepinella koalarum TaxID=53417 RepID=A0A4R1KZ44_9PAST|nr:hypothetical protein EV692_1084 [Lonepinella koalarum]
MYRYIFVIFTVDVYGNKIVGAYCIRPLLDLAIFTNHK